MPFKRSINDSNNLAVNIRYYHRFYRYTRRVRIYFEILLRRTHRLYVNVQAICVSVIYTITNIYVTRKRTLLRGEKRTHDARATGNHVLYLFSRPARSVWTFSRRRRTRESRIRFVEKRKKPT